MTIDKNVKKFLDSAIGNKRREINKIIVSKEKREIAQETSTKLTQLKNEFNILLDLMKEINNLSWGEIYRRISKYANRKNVNELADYISSDYYYGKEIYNMMKKGFSLDLAIKIFDAKVKLKMKNSKLSELASTANLLFFENNRQSLLFEKEFLNKRAIKKDPILTIRNGLLFSGEYHTKKLKGITLMSETKEGIKKLEILVNYIYETGNAQYLNKLSLEALANDLIIGDFTLHDNVKSYYSSLYTYIALPEDKTLKNKADDFYHETTHFLDNLKGKEPFKYDDSFFSSTDSTIKDILNEIKSRVNVFPRGLSLTYLTYFKTNEYINDPILNKKWLEQIKKENWYASSEDIELYMQQKRLYERKKYKILINSLLDIYDGLSNGLLYEFGSAGHGKKYYSDSEAMFKEFIADIGSIYNLDGIDILNHEFGPELTSKIIKIYESFIIDESEDKHKKVI